MASQRQMNRIMDFRLGCFESFRCRGLLRLAGLPALAVGWLAAAAPPAPAPSAALEPGFTKIEEVRKLTREQANRGLKVRLRGVVTFANKGWGNLFLQDETGGIGSWPWLEGCVAKPGDLIEYEGVTEQSGFGPSLRPAKVKVIGQSDLPAPLRHSYTYLLTGHDDAQWVEVEGVVRRVAGPRLTVMIQGGETTAWIDDVTDGRLGALVDASVRLAGVCVPIWNDKKQLVGISLLAPSFARLTVLQPAPADPFGLPASPVEALLRYNPDLANAGHSHRVKIEGVVTAEGNSLLYLQDQSSGARVEFEGSAPARPGDRVQAAGFARTSGYSALLTDALVRKIGQSPLPEPVAATEAQLFNGDLDARRVRVRGQLIEPVVPKKTQILRMQIENRVVRAFLPPGSLAGAAIPAGSVIEVRGVCSVSGPVAGAETGARSDQALPDLYLNSGQDVALIERAPWWTAEHAVAVMSSLAALLGCILVWVWTLRRRVAQRTRELRREIAERIRMEEEARSAQKQLLEVSRQAGMAEVATNVLHNVGNVLNSVNVSCTVVAEQIQTAETAPLEKLAELIERHAGEPSFLSTHTKGKMIPSYLRQLAAKKASEKDLLLTELRSLRENINHIMGIVSMQQTYAKVSGISETVAPCELVEDALRINAASFARHEVQLVREFTEAPALVVDKHKALQILVNLLHNAKHACDESNQPEKQIVVRVERNGGGAVKISVRDNGVGIAPENVTRIFAHGFTTRKDGHGFGLHSGALAAREMGGSLSAWSAGPGAGATFTLELPGGAGKEVP